MNLNAFRSGRYHWSWLLTAVFIASLMAVDASAQQTATGVVRDTKAVRDLQQWQQRQEQIQETAKRVMPAVVSITDQQSFGSGVVISKDGLVLTAGHVIIDSDRDFEVLFPDGRRVSAKPLGKNLNADAGMLKLEDFGDDPLPFVEVGTADSVRLGDWVVAIGHAGGYDLGRTPPLRLGRVLRKESEAFTSDCTIIGGDSGGPLFDLDGRLIGIHSSIGDSIVENRHVSIQVFLDDWDRLESGESWGVLPGTEEPRRRRRRPDRENREDEGSESQPKRAPKSDSAAEPQQPEKAAPAQEPSDGPMANEGTAALGVEVYRSDRRAIVRSIKPGSAASRVGLRIGDVVIGLDGVSIEQPMDLVRQISAKRAGDVVKIKIQRNGQSLEYQIILGEL